MSIRVMTSVWQYSACKGSDLLLLLAIADRADDDGYAWPKVATLATKTRMSERATQYNLKRLVEVGELEIQPNAGPNGTHMYRVVTKATGCKDCGVQDSASRVQKLHPRGATGGKKGVQPIAPYTSIDTSTNTSIDTMAISEIADVPYEYDERFESFWSHYPRKDNKRNAESAFLKLAPNDALLRQMVDAIDAQVEGQHFDGRKVTPHGSTWINGARWEDEVLPNVNTSDTMQFDSTVRDRAAFEEARRILNGGGSIIETTGGLINV